MNYLSLAVKIITAIPQAKQLFENLVALYYSSQINNLEDDMVTEENKRAELISLIQKAETNEQILIYSVMLDDYNSGKLQDKDS